jgi:hypothetical protein
MKQMTFTKKSLPPMRPILRCALPPCVLRTAAPQFLQSRRLNLRKALQSTLQASRLASFHSISRLRDFAWLNDFASRWDCHERGIRLLTVDTGHFGAYAALRIPMRKLQSQALGKPLFQVKRGIDCTVLRAPGSIAGRRIPDDGFGPKWYLPVSLWNTRRRRKARHFKGAGYTSSLGLDYLRVAV